MSCWVWKCVPTATSSGADISEVPGCHLLQQMSCQWGLQKLLWVLVSHELTAYLSVFDLFLTQFIMAILSKGCKPDKFEPHNSLKISFTNVWGFHSNFVECESFLEPNSPEGFPFTQGLFLENSVGSYLCFQLANFTHCLTSFSSINFFFFKQFFILFDIT